MQYIRQTHVTTHEYLTLIRFDSGEATDSIAQNVNQKIYLNDAAILAGKIITGIKVLEKNLDVANIIDGRTSLGINDLACFVITLVGTNNEKIIDRYPLSDFTRTYNKGKSRRLRVIADPLRSYVEQLFVQSAPSRNNVIPIVFNYQLPKK